MTDQEILDDADRILRDLLGDPSDRAHAGDDPAGGAALGLASPT